MADLARRDPLLHGVRVLVVGAGRSGVAAARLAAGRGALVTVTDRRAAADLGPAGATLEGLGAKLVAGDNPVALADAADLVVLSPGVPPDLPLLVAARRRGVPVWGEAELAARFCRGRAIGVTGSNGKSTVTSMVGAILREDRIPGGTGGNLGTPFCDLLPLDAEDAVHALELSSFQLETLETLRPVVAMFLNLSPDHLDRYPDLESYARAKVRLLALVPEDGHSILNADDPPSLRFRDRAGGRVWTFSTRARLAEGAWLEAGRLTLRTPLGTDPLCTPDELRVRGEHNVANALAAALACRLVGCSVDSIVRALAAFEPLPHRLQLVAALSGVAFYDDSKATNPASTETALAAFEPGRVHLILGGRDKGADWSQLVPHVRDRVRRVLLVGEAAPMLRGLLAGGVPLEDCGTVERAVAAGLAGARPGDVVLLAPGCASFDQYRNYEERGADFRRAVAALAARESGRG